MSENIPAIIDVLKRVICYICTRVVYTSKIHDVGIIIGCNKIVYVAGEYVEVLLSFRL